MNPLEMLRAVPGWRRWAALVAAITLVAIYAAPWSPRATALAVLALSGVLTVVSITADLWGRWR